MTFFTSTAPAGASAPVGLSQTGRSGLELLGSLQKFSSGVLRRHARDRFEASHAGQALAVEHVDPATQERTLVLDRVHRATALAEADPIYRLERFFQRYVACDIWNRGIPAVEERRAQFEPFLALPEGETAGSLELDPATPQPRYHSDIEWHLEPGGWDGYDLYGPVFAFGIGPLVFRHGGYAAVSIDGGAETQVNFYNGASDGNVLVWTSAALGYGDHTLTVRVTGTHPASSSGNYVSIDRGEVLN